MFGLVVLGQATVAIEMVRRYVEHRRRCQIEWLRPLQLEAGQFQHEEIGVGLQQVQGRRTQIAPCGHPLTATLDHGGQQGGDC